MMKFGLLNPASVAMCSVLAVACVQDQGSSSPGDSEAVALAGQCGEEAESCAMDCIGSADTDAFAACLDDLQACLSDGSSDPADCEAAANQCLADATGDQGDVTACLDQCSVDFGDCVPEPDDLGDANACVDDGLSCLGDCASAAGACQPPTIECEDGAFEEFVDCFANAQDADGAQLCLDAIAAACSLPTDLDLSCASDAGQCASDCATDIQECLDP